MFLQTKLEIENWLDKYKITNYKIIKNEDLNNIKKYPFVVNVNNYVNLSFKFLNDIPIKFNIINGDFNCSKNKLTSLEFCPKEVKGDFNCHFNKLTSLEYCPEIIKGDFNCYNNQLSSLEFCPNEVNGVFCCNNNQLTNLKYLTNKINGFLNISNNKISSLKYCPKEINGDFYFFDNKISNLKFLPKINGNVICYNNKFKSIDDLISNILGRLYWDEKIDWINNEDLQKIIENNKIRIEKDKILKALTKKKSIDINKVVNKKIKI